MTTTIHHQIAINATPEQVWLVLADLDRLADYDPVVTKSVVIGQTHEGLGARRRCDARQGRFFVEDVTVWEPPHKLQFAIVECNLPTTGLSHGYVLELTAAGTTVSETLAYDIRFGVVGRVLDRVIVRGKTEQGIRGFLAGLKATVEQSQPPRSNDASAQ